MPGTGAAQFTWRLAPQSSALLHLDALRFIAACAIVETHSQGLIDFGLPYHNFGIFVDVFFAISGFVIAYVYAGRMTNAADYRAFLLRRVARLGPLHWATLAAFVAIGEAARSAGVPINNEEAFDLSCVPANAAMLHATALCPHYSFNGPSWSISAEAIMYLAAPLIFLLMRRPLAAIVTFGAVLALLTATTGGEWVDWNASWGAVRAIPSFMLGVLLFYQRDRLRRLPFANGLYWGALLVLIAGVLLKVPHIWLLGVAYLSVIGGIAADIAGRTNAIATRLAPFGQLTYSIYMLHMLVLVVSQYLAANVLQLEGPAHTAFMIVAVAAVFPLGYLSFVVFETPARRWITGRRPQAPRASTTNGTPAPAE